MDFVTFVNPNFALPIVGGFLLIAAGVALGFAGKKLPNSLYWLPLLMASLLAIGLILVVSGAAWTVKAAWKEHKLSATQALAELYSVELSEDEALDLYYPILEAQPESDFEVYGSVENFEPTGAGSFTKQEIYLIWDQGQMKLAESENGENFEELSR